MAPLPATEWALPCQNVFEWKTQTEKFPPYSLPHCFFPLPPSLLLRFPSFPLPLHPSLNAPRKGISPSLARLSMNAAFTVRKTLSSSRSLTGALPELFVSVRYLPVTQKSILH